MKIHDVAQGSPEWLKLRLGIPTASEFHRIVTPGGKLAKNETSRKYAFYLATERLLMRSLDSIDNLEWVARGKELEPQAAAAYEFLEDVKTAPVGFITTDDMRMGASPDRIVLEHNAGVEFKCPAPQTQMEYLIDGFGPHYYVQAQGQIYVAGFDYVDRYAWHPEMPPVLQKTPADKPFQELLHDALNRFCDTLDEIVEKAKTLGVFMPAAQPGTWEQYLERLEEKSKYLDSGD